MVKKTPHCRGAGFEPQRTSSFRKRVKAHQVLGKKSRPSQNDDPSLCAAPQTFGGVGELYRRRSPFLKESFRCADPRPIRIGDEREWLVAASPVMTKSRGSSWGRNNYPENGLVNPPRRDTRALSPAGMFGGKAPPRLAAQSRPHAHLGPMRCAAAYFLCKWGVLTRLD